MSAIDYATEFTTMRVPTDFHEVDYAELNGIDVAGYIDEPDEWDFARHTED